MRVLKLWIAASPMHAMHGAAPDLCPPWNRCRRTQHLKNPGVKECCKIKFMLAGRGCNRVWCRGEVLFATCLWHRVPPSGAKLPVRPRPPACLPVASSRMGIAHAIDFERIDPRRSSRGPDHLNAGPTDGPLRGAVRPCETGEGSTAHQDLD